MKEDAQDPNNTKHERRYLKHTKNIVKEICRYVEQITVGLSAHQTNHYTWKVYKNICCILFLCIPNAQGFVSISHQIHGICILYSTAWRGLQPNPERKVMLRMAKGQDEHIETDKAEKVKQQTRRRRSGAAKRSAGTRSGKDKRCEEELGSWEAER